MAALVVCACQGTREQPVRNAAAPAPAERRARVTEDGGITFVTSACGLVAVGNMGAAHFTMELDGGEISVQAPGTFVVDDVVAQVGFAPASEIGEDARGRTGLDLLRAHQRWELAFHAGRIGGGVPQPIETPLRLPVGAPAGLLWRFELPATAGLAPGVTSPVFLTRVLRGGVLVLVAQGMKAQSPDELDRLLTHWTLSFRLFDGPVSPESISGGIRREDADGGRCAGGRKARISRRAGAPQVTPATAPAVNSTLRLDGVAADDEAAVRAFAGAHGGVERSFMNGGLAYLNRICRFEITYPPGWKDFSGQDWNGRLCQLNLMSPPVWDADDGENITNAVAIVARPPSDGFGVADLHRNMSSPMRNSGGTLRRVDPPLIGGALHEHFVVSKSGHRFEGELVTFERGGYLYHLLFTATPATFESGRHNFLDLVDHIRWNVEARAK